MKASGIRARRSVPNEQKKVLVKMSDREKISDRELSEESFERISLEMQYYSKLDVLRGILDDGAVETRKTCSADDLEFFENIKDMTRPELQKYYDEIEGKISRNRIKHAC